MYNSDTLQRLKNENRLLRQKVDQLENESNALADRLIQGQVDRAEVDETTFVMKRELAALRTRTFDWRRLTRAYWRDELARARISGELPARRRKPS